MSAAIAAAEKAPIHLHGNTFQLINADGNPGTLVMHRQNTYHQFAGMQTLLNYVF